MNSRNHANDLLDLGLQHTLKNWVARKEAPTEGREQLLAQAVRQNMLPKSKCKPGWFFHSKTSLNEHLFFSGHGYALDSVYAIKASMTIA